VVVDAVDVEELLERIDVEQLLARIDVDEFLDRVDVDHLLDRVDVNRVLDRVDVDRLMARVDIEALTRRAGIGEIVAASTSHITASALDLARRQMVGLDTVVLRVSHRLLGRDPDRLPTGPPALVAVAPATAPPGGRGRVTGHYAGVVTRLAAYLVDATLISLLFTLGLAALSLVLRVVAGVDVPVQRGAGWWWALGFGAWALFYLAIGLVVAGRTPGMGVVGLRVVGRGGDALRSSRALGRTLAFPLSFLVFGLGFVGIVVGRERRALHDVISGTAVVVDWGDRPAELPTPLSRFLAQRDANLSAPISPSAPAGPTRPGTPASGPPRPSTPAPPGR
jgi:uncharacterized RDD family membrane protein YckC